MPQRNDENRPLLSKMISNSGSIKRNRRPSHLILHAPPLSTPNGSSGGKTSLTSASTHPLFPKTAPCGRAEGLPRLAVQPATGASATFPSTTPQDLTPSAHGSPSSVRLTVSHKGSMASLSTFGGGSPPSPHDETSGSNSTIRGVEIADSSPSTHHQTEYSSSDIHWEETRRNPYVDTTSPHPGQRYGTIDRTIKWNLPTWSRSPESASSSAGTRRLFRAPRAMMHEVWLATQCFVFLLVFGVLVSMSIWEGSSTDADFWVWIWKTTQPSLLTLLLGTFILLLIHEARSRGLSTVVLLYMQSAALLIVSITSLLLASRSFEQGSLAVRAVVMGCVVVMWGWSVLGFVRVAVVWGVECWRTREGDMEEMGRW